MPESTRSYPTFARVAAMGSNDQCEQFNYGDLSIYIFARPATPPSYHPVVTPNHGANVIRVAPIERNARAWLTICTAVGRRPACTSSGRAIPSASLLRLRHLSCETKPHAPLKPSA